MNPQKIVTWITGILTLSLTAFSFTLSFTALKDLAQQNSVSIPWMFPFVVEKAVIVFSLVTLFRSIKGLPTGYNWTLIITSSLLAGFFNVAHAYPKPLSMFMAAMPSLFLLLSFESFLGLLKITIDSRDVTHSLIHEIKKLKDEMLQSDQKLKQLTNENVTLKDKCNMLQKELKNSDVTENVTLEKKDVTSKKEVIGVQKRREKVLKMLQEDVTQDEIADKLNVSRMTIVRDVKALNGNVSLIP